MHAAEKPPILMPTAGCKASAEEDALCVGMPQKGEDEEEDGPKPKAAVGVTLPRDSAAASRYPRSSRNMLQQDWGAGDSTEGVAWKIQGKQVVPRQPSMTQIMVEWNTVPSRKAHKPKVGPRSQVSLAFQIMQNPT